MSKKKIVFLMTACKKLGPVQQMLNIIKNLDRDEFEPHLVTLYPETTGSQLDKYLPYVEHHFAPSGKLALVTGRDTSLRKVLEEIKPDVIHSLGVFPDFAGRYINALIHNKMLPLWLPKKKLTSLLNKVACESHRDKLTYILFKQIHHE